jgi:L-gulonolactone oxidase
VFYLYIHPLFVLPDLVIDVILQYPQYTVEWAIPYERTKECLLTLKDWLERELANPSGTQPHFPIEIRFSEADDIWMSPSSGRQTCWIGLIQYK